MKEEKSKYEKIKKDKAQENQTPTNLTSTDGITTKIAEDTNKKNVESVESEAQKASETITQKNSTTTKKDDSTTIEVQTNSTTIKQKENKEEMKNEQKTEKTETTPAQMTSKERVAEANHIVKNRMIASVGAGLIPFPVVDIVALTGIQLDAIRALSKLYNVKFSKDMGKSAISSLTGGVVPVAAGPWVSSLAKTIPVVGQIMGTVSMPIIAGASTYAVGKVFIQHFESGGTFLTFNPEKVKDYFQEEYEKGKDFAKTEAKVS